MLWTAPDVRREESQRKAWMAYVAATKAQIRADQRGFGPDIGKADAAVDRAREAWLAACRPID